LWSGASQLKWRQTPLKIERRKVMEWFNQKTSIAGIQVSNWTIALGALIVLLLAYSLM
jgi:hypothetical protein